MRAKLKTLYSIVNGYVRWIALATSCLQRDIMDLVYFRVMVKELSEEAIIRSLAYGMCLGDGLSLVTLFNGQVER